MRRPKTALVLALATLAIALMTGWAYPREGGDVFASFPEVQVDLTPTETFVQVSVEDPESKGQIAPFYPLDPILSQGQEAMMSLRDVQAIMKTDDIYYDQAQRTVNIDQLRRLVLPLDKNVYLEASAIKGISAPPTIHEDQVYVPLRLVFEEMGYDVNFNGQGREIIISKKRVTPSSIIPADDIRAVGIEGEMRNIRIIEVLDFRQGRVLGLGEDREGDKFVFNLDQAGKADLTPLKTRADLGPAFASDGGKVLNLQEGRRLIGIDVTTGQVKTQDLPIQMEGVDLFGAYGGSYYGTRDNEVYVFDTEDKSLVKDQDLFSPGPLRVLGKWLIYQEGTGLFAHDLDTGKTSQLDYSRQEGAFAYVGGRDQVLVYCESNRNYYKVYDLEEGRVTYSRLIKEGQTPLVSVTSAGQVTLLIEGDLVLVDLARERIGYYDLINLAEDQKSRYYRWFYDGRSLVGIEERSYRNIYIQIEK